MQLNKITNILQNWGKKNSLIKTIHIFGSRVRNDFRADSDLDIAITLNIEDCNDRTDKWIHCKREWHTELTNLIPYKIQLELKDEATKIIEKGINMSSVLVYSKA